MSKNVQIQETMTIQDIVKRYEKVIFELSAELKASNMREGTYKKINRVLGRYINDNKIKKVVFDEIITNINKPSVHKSQSALDARAMEIFNRTCNFEDELKSVLGVENLDDFGLDLS